MSAFSTASAASSVLPWLFSPAQAALPSGAGAVGATQFANVPQYLNTPASALQAWLPAVSSLQLTLPDSLALMASMTQKSAEKVETTAGRVEPLDLTVKPDIANSADFGYLKDQQLQLQLAALSSFIPYWNALAQSQRPTLPASTPVGVNPNVIAALSSSTASQKTPQDSGSDSGNCDRASPSAKLAADALPGLLKLLENGRSRQNQNGNAPSKLCATSTDAPTQTTTTSSTNTNTNTSSTTLFGRGCKFDAFCQQFNQTQANSPSGPRHHSAAASTASEAQAQRTSCDQDDDAKFTDYSCTCGRRYNTVYHLARHLCESGHKPLNNRDEGNDIVKLVRGQDMWLNNETEQTRQILRCMQCKMSCSNLTELILHMVTTKHFAEIVYGSSSIAERYKLNECIFNDSSANDVDNDHDNDNDNETDVDAIGNTAVLSRIKMTEEVGELRKRKDNSNDAALENIDIIGDNLSDSSDCENPPQDEDAPRLKRSADDGLSVSDRDSSPSSKRCRIMSADGAPESARTELAVIREKTPSPAPTSPSALHSLSKFCEKMRFEPASIAATRSHTPLGSATGAYAFLVGSDCQDRLAAVRRDCDQSIMQVLVPNELTDTDKQSPSPLRSLEKFVHRNGAATRDSSDSRTNFMTNLDQKFALLANGNTDEPSSTTVEHQTSGPVCLNDSVKASNGASRGKPHVNVKPKFDKSKNKRVLSADEHHHVRGNAGGQTPIPILKKCVCEYCHKRFANKGQVRLHLSKNKCAVLLACFGHQRLQKMSASNLLSGSRAMVINSLLYNAPMPNSATEGSGSNEHAKEPRDASKTSCLNSTTGDDLVDRFAKYYEMARNLAGTFNGSS